MEQNGAPGLPATGSLLVRARRGDSRALSQLLRVQGDRLRAWARGRIPAWARELNDTADLVQDALLRTLQRVDRFEDRGKGSLQAYLRTIVTNAVHDQERRVLRRPVQPLEGEEFHLASSERSPFLLVEQEERDRLYRDCLQKLGASDRLLVVGRLDLDLSYQQLALMTGRATAGAARVATRRAVARLGRLMGNG
jgi:RNA polymerase sigma factor (sigma-70 family)